MNVAQNKHFVYQGLIQYLIQSNSQEGCAYPRCQIQTNGKVNLADVVWVSSKRYQTIRHEAICSIAPEICVRIQSLANHRQEFLSKKEAYFQAGAQEFWLCDENGKMSFYNSAGLLKHSSIFPTFPKILSL